MRILVIVSVILSLTSCNVGKYSWEEIKHQVHNRDTRINIFNLENDLDTMIYVGVGSDFDEKMKNKWYTKAIINRGAQHHAPKEIIAKQQCVKNFSLEKAVYKETIVMTEKRINEYRLGFKKYAKFLCEKSDAQLAYEQQEKEKELIVKNEISNNTKIRRFTCSYSAIPSEKSKINIEGPKAYETTSIGVKISYTNVNLSDKGAFTLQGASNDPGRVWFIGAQSFLLLDTKVLTYNCY